MLSGQRRDPEVIYLLTGLTGGNPQGHKAHFQQEGRNT